MAVLGFSQLGLNRQNPGIFRLPYGFGLGRFRSPGHKLNNRGKSRESQPRKIRVRKDGIRTLRYTAVRYIGISREVSEDANGNFERTNAKSYKLSAEFTHNYSLASVLLLTLASNLLCSCQLGRIRLSPRESRVNMVL